MTTSCRGKGARTQHDLMCETSEVRAFGAQKTVSENQHFMHVCLSTLIDDR